METDDEEEEVEEDETLVEKVSISNQDLEEAGSSKGMQGGTSSATEGEVDLTRNTRRERQPRTKDRYQELVLYNLSLNQSGLILLEVCLFNIELGNIVYLSVKEYIRRKKIAPKGIYCLTWLGQG